MFYLNKSLHQEPNNYRGANSEGQFLDVNNDVKNRLADVGVEVHNGLAELVHILGEELVSIADAVVQVIHLVVSEPPGKSQHVYIFFTRNKNLLLLLLL